MAQQFTNNARSVLVSGIDATNTSIVVEADKADLFPTANTGTNAVPAATNWFKATLQDTAGNVEIVYVRSRVAGSAVMSNVIRGQEGTTARAFTAGTVIGLRITALDIEYALGLLTSDNTWVGDNAFAGAATFDSTTTFAGAAAFDGQATFSNAVDFSQLPTAPTATVGTADTQLATTAFVDTAVSVKADIDSPTFTGTPAAPTASPGANTTQVATTAFVTSAIAAIPAVERASQTVYGTMKAWVSGTTLYLQTT